MRLEIKVGMVVGVINLDDKEIRPYFVSKITPKECEGGSIIAYPLYDMQVKSCMAFQIPWYRIKELLGETLQQYMTKCRNKGYLGSVCLSPNDRRTAVVTEYREDGSVAGVRLEDGELWETDFPIKLADSVHDFVKEQASKGL